MGFFTQLGDLWGSGANYGFSKSWDLLGDAWGKTKDSAKTFASGVWGLATSPFDDKRSVMDAFLNLNYSFADASKQLGEAGLGLFGAATEVPVVKQMFGTAGFIQNEFVKRPLGTGFLMAGDVGLGKTSWFDKQAWVQAYNDTRYVSTGQAAVYSAFNSSDIGRQTPELDPRSQESQEAYRSNAQLKYASGTADAAVDVFADPTVYGGKALAALKLRYISRPLRTAAQVDRYVDSANYTRLREYVRQAPNPEALRQEVFNSHRGGDKAAALLWDVRNDDDLFDATFNSLYGDKEAWAYLIENAPRIAQVTGRIYANQTIARAVDEAGISARSTGTVDALRETESQAFVDAIANGNGAWGAGHGALIGQSAPRLTVTSKWRAGVHNWLTFGPQVFRGSPIFPVASRARYVLPSARFTRFMDVNDLNSVGAFRANLERAPLSREQVEDFVSQYGRASSPESRARIAGDAEDAAFREMAAAHGFTTADVENALPAINRWRTASRQMFSSSRRFMSRDVMNLYEQYTGAGREREADNAFFLNGEMEDAVRRGDQPADVYWMLDEDGNNVMIPGRFNVDPARPVTLSQRADIVAMQDWRSLDSALWWTRNGPLGGVKRSAYTVINGGSALLDAVNTVWKVTSLLRPGYLWRMLSDDVMRRAALIGAAPVAMSTAQGLARAGVNAARRGGLVVDAASAYRQRRGLDPVDRLEADVEDDNGIVGAIGGSDPLTREPLGGPYAPAEDAVAMSTGNAQLRSAIEATAGRARFTKADIRRELGVGDAVANRLIGDLTDRGLVEVERVAGRVTYRRSRVDPSDLGLLYQPLDYATYDRALADGVLSVPDYLERVEFHADRGDLPAELAQLVQGRRDGTLAPARTLQRDYQRNVIDRSLRSVGRGAYSFPEWQQSFVDAVQERYRLRNQGDTGAPVVVDPTTGLTPENVTPDQFALTRGASVEATADELYRYVADNIDDLLRPRSLLHAYMAPNGRMNLAVGRFRGGAEAGAEFGPAVIRPTGGSRLRFRGGDVQRAMSGNVPVAVATPQGVMQFQPAFEGAEGNRFMAQASSRGEQGAWTDQMSDTQYARLVNESRSQRDVLPNEPQYQVSWERAVNTQLANDAVARQFMAGRSVDDVMNWMRNTPEGRAYYGRLGPWQSRPVDQVYAVQAMVDTYLPRVAGDAATDATTANLRRAALDGEASYTDFQRLFPNAEDMPAVHGASLDVTVGGPFTNAVKRGVSRIFNILSDIPADRASRFPFFADRYQAHLNDIAPRFAEQAGDATLVPTADIDKIQQLARSRALADVKKYLYDTSAALDMARAGRLVVPFGSAIADSFLKWGVIARERGIAPPALQIWKLWTAPDRAGLVQDEDGNVKRYNPKTGDYQWYGKNPKTGELTLLPDHDPKQEYIVFQLPVGAPKTASGAVMPAYINKQTFNTFLGLPTAGPIVAYPANEFELRNPKLADQWFMKKFVLPFGPTSDRWKAFLPSNVRSTYNAFTEDPPSRRGLAQAVLQTEYTRWALGERSAPPTMEEVNNTAGDLYGLQYMSQLFGVSTQFKSPYQPYVDYYRSLREQDPENALARFYNDMGDEYRMMTASVSRNVAGLPVASVENAKTIQKYQDLVAKFPELSGLIIGSEGAGSFSSAVYQAQLEQSLQPGSDQKMREILSPQESVEDAERKYVWVKYGKMMDAIEADMIRRGVKDLNSKRAKDLKKTRDQFIEANKYWTTPQGATDVSPWFSEFSTTDRAKMTSRLTAMAQIVSDDRIGQRDDMRGLYDYLSARIQVKAEMQRRGYATLDSKKAATLSKRWTQYVSGLKESNVSFAALYNRWLVGDDLTADIILQPEGVTGG